MASLINISYVDDVPGVYYNKCIKVQTETERLQTMQGVLGIKVKIMLDWDPKGKQGPKTPLPDLVTIHAPKDEDEYGRPAVLGPEI